MVCGVYTVDEIIGEIGVGDPPPCGSVKIWVKSRFFVDFSARRIIPLN